jgi:glycosyltransferase involved in cell wall biosynthesis
MMRIGLDITQAVKRQGRGIARYIRQVLPPLAKVSHSLEIKLCIRGDRWWRRSQVSELLPDNPRSWLPISGWMSSWNLDLFHSFGNHLPARSGIPLTFTIHDFRALDRPSGQDSGGDRLRRNIERASGVLCLTEHGKARLRHHYPEFNPALIAVVPHGVDRSVFCPQDPKIALAAAQRYGLQQPFMLQLGSWFPHKNLELSVRAFACSRARAEGQLLAFVGGGASQDYMALLTELARSEGVQDSIFWIENVSGPDLPGLLAAASCLLQPSRYEGFGLPLLEAMAAGIPGVVSDSSCLPEVSGGIWPISGVDDAAAFAAGMDDMALDGPARNAAILSGFERAAQFTWETSAQKTADFYHRVLESTSREKIK